MLIAEDERGPDLEHVPSRPRPADEDAALAEAVDDARRRGGGGELDADEKPAAADVDDRGMIERPERFGEARPHPRTG